MNRDTKPFHAHFSFRCLTEARTLGKQRTGKYRKHILNLVFVCPSSGIHFLSTHGRRPGPRPRTCTGSAGHSIGSKMVTVSIHPDIFRDFTGAVASECHGLPPPYLVHIGRYRSGSGDSFSRKLRRDRIGVRKQNRQTKITEMLVEEPSSRGIHAHFLKRRHLTCHF